MRFLERWGTAFLDLILPGRCASCASVMAEPKDVFCELCASTNQAAERPSVSTPGLLTGAASPLFFGGAVATAICRLKYYDHPQLAKPLARLLVEGAADMPTDGLLIPVPLHPRRLRERGYNQAALLASSLAKLSKRAISYGTLRRRRDTSSQAQLDRAARWRNVEGAFAARPRLIAGRKIILIDDVLTTGFTAAACAAALRDAGASAVYCLTLARAMTSWDP